MKHPALLVVMLAAAAAGACRANGTSSGDPGTQAAAITVVTSIAPLAMIVSEIGGSRVAVSSLLSAGASPHTFEPRTRDLKRIRRAGVIVRVGRGFDDWLARIVATAASSAEIVVIGDINGLATAAAGSDADLARRQRDPHVWLDPLLVRDVIAPAVAAALERSDAAGATRYAESLAAFQARLELLDEEIRKILPSGSSSGYVAFHNAWRYFANRYGLHEVDVVYEFAGEEPSPRELARLITAARDAGVTAILVEPQLDPRMAEVIARDFHATTITVDPLGDLNDATRNSYERLMRFNAAAFARALAPKNSEEPLTR